MNVKIIKKSDYKTSRWSGGTTSEIYIYPENSEYVKRNFLFRISTAKVIVKESDFTKLEGVTRHLMIISGHVKLVHDNKYEKELKQFNQDIFKGDWNTKSYSTEEVKDFNLMTKEGCHGFIEMIELNEKRPSYESIERNSTDTIQGFYIAQGRVHIETPENTYKINQGEMFLLRFDRNESSIINILAKDDDNIKIIKVSVILE